MEESWSCPCSVSRYIGVQAAVPHMQVEKMEQGG